MADIEKWFKEAQNLVRTFETLDGKFVIYKGFKISNKGDTFYIQDSRFSNMYGEVSKQDLNKFLKMGFIAGADLISLERDSKRILSYKRRAELLYDKRKKFEKELPKNKTLNEKRIRNINRRIDEYVDLMFFYEVRVKQFNIKKR